MTQLASVGSFLSGTAVATTQVAVTGVGFQPKVVLMWWNGLNGSGNILQRNNIRRGFGAAISSSDRRNAGGQSQDAVSATSTDHETGNESCVRVLSTSGALAGALDVVSMDSDGFTLVVDTQFTTDLRVHYLALGGTSITNVKTGLVDEPASTGNQATTGLGFQPDVLIFFSAAATGASPTQAGHHITSLGFAAGSGQMLTAWRDQDVSTSSGASAYGASGDITGRITFNSGNLIAYASLASFDTDGFTLNWGARAFTGVDYFYLAIKGGTWLCGELLTQTDTTTSIPVTGLGSAPSAVLFISASRAESTLHTSTQPGGTALSVGAATSATDRLCTHERSRDGVNPSNCLCGQRTDAVYLNSDDSGTASVVGLMDVQSFDSDGFTCIMDDADPSQAWVGYLAAGGGTASPSGGGARSFVAGMIG